MTIVSDHHDASTTGSTTASTPVPPLARARHGSRRLAGTGLEVLGFGLTSLGALLNRRGKQLTDHDLHERPQHEWTSASHVDVSFDRQAAADWAIARVDAPPSVKANCAYFVSESLHLGGGLPLTDRWMPGTISSRVRRNQRIAEHPAFGCAADFVIEMQRVGYARLIGVDTMEPRPPHAEIGDVIVYNWDGRGGYQHVAMVTGFFDGTMHVTQQTPSQLHRPWNRYGDGNWISSASLLRFATTPAAPTR